LLGHAEARTTERYAHLDNDPLRRATNAIGSTLAAAMLGDGQRDTTQPLQIARKR
jgi:hypothetical protein